MCLAVPARVESVDHENLQAEVIFNGRPTRVSLAMLEAEELPQEGDYVVVQYGYAMARLAEAEALATRHAIQELQAGLDPSLFEESLP